MKRILSLFALTLLLLVGCAQADEGYAYKITVNDGKKEAEYVADSYSQMKGSTFGTLSVYMYDKEGNLITKITGKITITIERIEVDE
ncbi:hypothetical protein J26TS2_00130 [Shouchella clausii]|nr:hypothetical protein J26TS2_00130 [Shouchella clausii]